MAIIFFPGTYLLTSFLAYWLRFILGARKTPAWRWGCVGVAAAQAFLLSVNAGPPSSVDRAAFSPDGNIKAMVSRSLSDLAEYEYRAVVLINPKPRLFTDLSEIAAVLSATVSADDVEIKWDGPKKLLIGHKKAEEQEERPSFLYCVEEKLGEVEIVPVPPVQAPPCSDPKFVTQYWASKE